MHNYHRTMEKLVVKKKKSNREKIVLLKYNQYNKSIHNTLNIHVTRHNIDQ